MNLYKIRKCKYFPLDLVLVKVVLKTVNIDFMCT